MRKLHILMLVCIAAVSIVASAIPQNAHSEMMTLRVGESKTLEDSGLQIGFDGILSDSRCPENLLCIWEGDAVALIWAVQPSNDKLSYELHTYRDFQWQVRYNDYTIKLMKVAPYPKMDDVIDPEEYKVTLDVTDLTSTESSTWSRIKALLQ